MTFHTMNAPLLAAMGEAVTVAGTAYKAIPDQFEVEHDAGSRRAIALNFDAKDAAGFCNGQTAVWRGGNYVIRYIQPQIDDFVEVELGKA